MIRELLVTVATLLAVAGNVPYLVDMVKGRVKPHPYTWFVWSVVSCVTFFGGLLKGAGMGAIPTGVSESFTIIIFLFSLHYGFKNIPKRDTYFLLVSLLGLIPWIITKDPTVSVVTVVSIDVIAFIPTLSKTWNHPRTETSLLYGSNVLRHALTLCSLQAYNIATTIHSIAMIITNSLMVVFIEKKKRYN